MLTINLEKELIRQNKKILLPQELLSIKEYERLGDDICNDEILSRVGLNQAAVKGKKSKDKLNHVSKKLAEYDQGRIFHISQIESLCKKYHLRFLRADLFKGAIDSQLSGKLASFEIAHDVKIGYYSCKIAAPAKSFALEERPKDPLFFFDLGDGYWYLIHKWGNDLSVIRRFYRILSNAWLTFFTVISALMFVVVSNSTVRGENIDINGYGIAGIACLFVYIVASIICAIETNGIRFVKENDWQSGYL